VTSDTAPRHVFDLLTQLNGDETVTEIFSETSMIRSWLRSEVALARAQSKLGLIRPSDKDAIARVARVENVDRPALWAEARVVGYPILPLVRQLDALLPAENQGTLHLGATTQDIMDTGLVLQLIAAADCLQELVAQLGDVVEEACAAHVDTVMPGRTHALHAVPTTWGAKLAVYLSDLARHADAMHDARDRVAAVSLYGAGGTSAAYGPEADEIRTLVAKELGLKAEAVPWHVSRGRLAEWVQSCVNLTGTLSRLAREVIDLSRNEIAEVTERSGHLRGASSTMPQKANPITSEILVGTAIVMGGLAGTLGRVMEAGHERAAGEWQAEWYVLPQAATLTASALRAALDLVAGLEVHGERMRDNLELDQGLVMSEAYMISLAGRVGRERAHDLVYHAARHARGAEVSLRQALAETLPHDLVAAVEELDASAYVGTPATVVAAAIAAWRQAPRPGGRP
jgi:3-carboxy-cis,cis-muconate cycloisomerase